MYLKSNFVEHVCEFSVLLNKTKLVKTKTCIMNECDMNIDWGASIPCKLVIPSRFISRKTHFVMLAGS